MADSEDSDYQPTQPWVEPSGPQPPPAVKLSASSEPDRPRSRWQAPTPEEVQRSFPLYEIVGLLGRGGMGAVYKGWQKSLHRFVAIKILPRDIEGETTNYAERFQREARAMARVQHPSIVAVHDAGETPDGLLYFIMEYIEGTDLQKMLLASGKLAPADAVTIAMQVCDALDYAHRHGVIHRDIKPSNILIGHDRIVKVADFGLAKLTTEDCSLLTGSHITMGSRDFMAPEALAGMENVDHRADGYAVGVMLYQMLTGELPRGRFDLPSVHTPGLDARFDGIIDRAMQKDPDRRYSSAIELRSDLERVLAEPAASVGEHSAGGTRQLATTTNRTALSLGLATAIVAVIAGAIYLARQNTQSGDRTPSTVATEPRNSFATATKDHPFENSLGMKFVPVPIIGGPSGGQRVLFSIWETRVQDYGKLIEEQGVEWPRPHFDEPAQPAVNLTWDEARTFCDWLTKREHNDGRIAATERYRLPTDHEWSCTVGLGDRENPAETPAEKHMKITDAFPWGATWPPPAGAGNYSGEETLGYENWDGQKILAGYRDPYPEMAPVGSFQANPLGLFDLGGNAHEWCEDRYQPEIPAAVLRGGSYVNRTRENLISSYRLNRPFDTRGRGYGFRMVLAGSAPSPGTPAAGR